MVLFEWLNRASSEPVTDLLPTIQNLATH